MVTRGAGVVHGFLLDLEEMGVACGVFSMKRSSVTMEFYDFYSVLHPSYSTGTMLGRSTRERVYKRNSQLIYSVRFLCPTGPNQLRQYSA